ncbi:MarR family winged helix-turn-helix transcriptional regulator [Pseudoalteromonas mariniglutinosa]|uniref:MarR family winged helix-turn-helix transcriptional regulator n=1 Tax=Pseudoalteromonas mariniglutinosa TaxID=206042 RepID=UPI00384B24E1
MAIDLSQFLPYQLTNLATLLSTRFAQTYEQKYQLSIPQWRIIANLAQYGQSTGKGLCVQANMDKSTVSRAIKKLSERQLIVASSNEKDKRASYWQLSEQGAALYQRIVPEALEWEQALLSVLNNDEYTQLIVTIEKLTKQLQRA